MDDTVRLVAAFGASLAMTALAGSWAIARLRRYGEPNVSDSARLAQLHRAKDRTPTMGGVWFLAAWLPGVILWIGHPATKHLVVLSSTLALAALGVWDDVQKVRTKRGLGVGRKLVVQVLIASLTLVALGRIDISAMLHGVAPFWPQIVTLGVFGWPLALLALVGAANAVNLTDGLDGLAGGCVAIVLVPLAAAAWIAGDADTAARFHVWHVAEGRSLAIATAGLLGAVLAFLYFNRHPARVFMGNTGALALGGWMGGVAVVLRQELWLLVLGGVLAAEALSVMLQVGSFRLTGRRIFRCAPLHHHFQFCGWRETKVVRMFWAASVVCAAAAVAGLAARQNRSDSDDVDSVAQQSKTHDRSSAPLADASNSYAQTKSR